LLWVVALLNYCDRLMITSMRLSLRDAFQMSDAHFGLLTSVFLWVYGVLSPAAGFLADRFGRTRVIVGSLFVWSLATGLTAFAQNWEQLLASRVIMGISEACYIPAALALIADYHRGPTRSLATGIHMTGIYVGSILGGAGGWIADHYGWYEAFRIFGFGGLVYSIFLLLVLRDVPEDAASGESAAREPTGGLLAALGSLFSNVRFLLLLAFWTILGMAGWTLVGWMPTYLNEQFGLSQGAAGLSATGYYQIAAFVGVLASGAWADWWSRRTARARMFVPMIGVFLAVPAVLMLAGTSLLPLALLGLAICGFGRAFTDSNMMPMLCLVADRRYRATGYGVLNSFACIAGGAMIYIAGALKDHNVNLSVMLYFAASYFLVCGVLLWLVKPHGVDDAVAQQAAPSGFPGSGPAASCVPSPISDP